MRALRRGWVVLRRRRATDDLLEDAAASRLRGVQGPFAVFALVHGAERFAVVAAGAAGAEARHRLDCRELPQPVLWPQPAVPDRAGAAWPRHRRRGARARAGRRPRAMDRRVPGDHAQSRRQEHDLYRARPRPDRGSHQADRRRSHPSRRQGRQQPQQSLAVARDLWRTDRRLDRQRRADPPDRRHPRAHRHSRAGRRARPHHLWSLRQSGARPLLPAHQLFSRDALLVACSSTSPGRPATTCSPA